MKKFSFTNCLIIRLFYHELRDERLYLTRLDYILFKVLLYSILTAVEVIELALHSIYVLYRKL